MSDPNRKMDVEDVLSSIRRLVSEQARSSEDVAVEPPHSGSASAPSAPPSSGVEDTVTPPEPNQSVEPTEADKLVLTQSLRIAGAEAGAADIDIAAAASELAQRISDIDLSVTADAADPSTAEMADQPVMQTPNGTSADEASVGVLETAASPNTPEAAKSDPPVTPTDGDQDTGPLQMTSPIKMPGDSALQSGKELAPDAAAQQNTEKTVDPLPQDTSPDDNRDPEQSENPIHVGQDASLGMIDEESLRDLVTEMVRSELQGELGDRITRNVRKMVRREIQRAFSARELD